MNFQRSPEFAREGEALVFDQPSSFSSEEDGDFKMQNEAGNSEKTNAQIINVASDASLISFPPPSVNSSQEMDNKYESTKRGPLATAALNLLLARAYVEEATYGRNGYFIPERKQLRMYYWYNHGGVRLCLYLLLWINLSLIVFEKPAVDQWELPYWGSMLIEILCLSGYFGRLVHSWSFMPQARHWKDRKVMIVLICILLTLIDMGLYIVLIQTGNENYALRWSRVLRPAFMINFSESRQVRRAIRNIRRILPEIMNVLILLLLVISLYALLGLKLFEKRGLKDLAGNPYFSNYFDNYFSLYVLTTTANNPDVMIPAYNKDNWYSLYFVIFLITCLYIFVSIILAVVYKNYRKHLKNEVKASVYRKRRNLREAFEYLKTKRDDIWVITFQKWKALLQFMYPRMSPVKFALMWQVLDSNKRNYIEFKDFVHITDLLTVNLVEIKDRPHLFERMCPNIYHSTCSKLVRKCVEHRCYVYIFDIIIIANAICIGMDWDETEIGFLVIFNFEIISKLYTFGPKEFFSKFWNIFDFVVIGGATITFIFEASFDSLRYSEATLDFLLVLRVLRLFKIVGNIKRFQVIINTILQIGPAILTYGGIVFIQYYVFAVIGMEVFSGKVKDGIYTNNISSVAVEDRHLLFCGNSLLKGSEFYRLRYCGKNFNNVLKSFSILFDLTVVNQWHVLTDGYVRVTSKFARLYFMLFHLTCVIVVLNIFVAFILEAFMVQYSLSESHFESILEKKISEEGAKIGMDPIPEDGFPINADENPLNENFSVAHYVNNTRIRYKLRPQRTTNAESLLQKMFEDELDEEDFGPELKNSDDLDDVVELVENRVIRKLTLMTVDSL